MPETSTSSSTSLPVTIPVTLPSPKPGYKTTEFWLTAVAALGGLLLASGAFPETSAVAKAVGLVMSGLATMGYTSSRSAAKAPVLD